MANTEEVNYTTLCLNRTHQNIAHVTVNSTLALIAFLGNVLIIVALQKVSSLHPPSKLLLGCLAFSDLCVGLITQPLHAAILASPEDSKICFYLTALFNILGSIFMGVSLLTLTAISVDRLLALLSGLRYKQVVTLRRAWIFVALFWLQCLGVAIILFFNYRTALAISCIEVLFCIVTSFLCYTKIYLTLRHHQAQIQETVHHGQTNVGRTTLNIERYKKTVSSALWVQIALAVCYIPFAIVTTIFVSRGLQHTQLLELLLEAAISFVLFNSSLNPFLYCWKMKEVRQAAKVTIKQFCCSSW